MFSHGNDLSKRQPVYNTIEAELQSAQQSGAFEGIDPEIVAMMGNMTTTGLLHRYGSSAALLAVPDSYDSVHRPLVLALHDEERVIFDTRDAITASLRGIVSKHSLSKTVPPRQPKNLVDMHVGPASVLASVYVNEITWNHTDKPATSLFVPAVMTIPATTVTSPRLAPSVAHELDHWIFLTQLDPLNPTPALSNNSLRAHAERRAYPVSYRVEQNLGLHKNMPNISELTATYSPTDDPGLLGLAIQRDFITIRKREGLESSISQSLAAVALSHLLADSATGELTKAEQTAYVYAKYA